MSHDTPTNLLKQAIGLVNFDSGTSQITTQSIMFLDSGQSMDNKAKHLSKYII